MKKFLVYVFMLGLIFSINAQTIYVKDSTKQECEGFFGDVRFTLEKGDYILTDEPQDADMVLSLFISSRAKRNLNWGGLIVSYPLFGIFHDVARAEVVLKVKRGEKVIFNEKITKGAKEGYLFSDFKGGLSKVNYEARRNAVIKAIEKFVLLNDE